MAKAVEENHLLPMLREEELVPQFPYMKNVIRASQRIFMWPNCGERNFFFYHSMVWLLITNAVLFILTFLIRIQMDFKNMDEISEMIDFITVLISGCFRYVYIYVKGRQYLDLVQLIKTRFVHYSFIRHENPGSLEKYYKLANRVILFYGCFTYLWIIQLCLMPLGVYIWKMALSDTTNGTDIPFPVLKNVYVPFNVYTQPTNAIFYAYQASNLLFFGSIYVVVDSFWYMVIFLTIGQFVLIKESLNTINDILENRKVSGEDELLKKNQLQEVRKGLKKCIEHHQFTRSFVHMIDDLNNPNVIVDSLHAVVSIGFILLDVTIALNNGDWNKVMYSMGYLVTSIVHMFFFDWLGNELSVKEEELAEAIYQIPWYKCPTLKTEILLVTVQSRRPYNLTGGKMYKLSLEFFTSTIKAVFSYFTFLFQMRNATPKSKA